MGVSGTYTCRPRLNLVGKKIVGQELDSREPESGLGLRAAPGKVHTAAMLYDVLNIIGDRSALLADCCLQLS